MNCPFCKFDNHDISNTIIEETDNFLIVPSKGSLCNGYLLIVPKVHKLSMNELNTLEKEELLGLIKKYREKFNKIYGQFPIFFEHGSTLNSENSSSSVTHAHTHIVNHNFKNQHQILKELNMQKVTSQEFFNYKNQNYISYITPDLGFYITYDFKPVSQQMRIYIANDLHLTSQYNWRTSNFDNNINKTINSFKSN